MKLAVNSIIEDVATRKRFRVLQISKDVTDVIAMEDPYRLPESMQTEEVEEYLLTDVYKTCEEEDHGHYLGGLTEKQKKNIDSIWEMIEPFVLDRQTCFDPGKRNIFIKDAVERTGHSRSTIQRWLHRYWAGGSTKMALVPQFKKRGGAGAERNGKKPIGRPRKYNTVTGSMRIGEIQKKQIQHIIKTLYNKNEKLSMKYAYEAFLKAYYFDNETNKLSEAYPTLTQFRYHAQKSLDIRTRMGEKKFDRNYRAITGNSAMEAEGPGEKYQIDATVADVYLVSRTDRNLIVGRPVLYFVTDVFSRMITGFYVSLEGPSWVDAMMALYYTNMDKVELCKQFEIDIEEDEWPCCGLPQQLLTDNGELVSKASNQLVSELGIHMQNTSAWRPDMKAIVEQSFHLHNSKTRMMLPGSIQPDFGERGAPDYKLDATLNLREFTQMVIRYILKYNRHTLTRKPQKDEDVQMDHVRAIPLELWNWGITHRSGCLTKKTSQEVAYALLPRSMARVTERGIKYKSLYYSSSSFVKNEWGSKARMEKTWQVEIKHDPRMTWKIILCHSDGTYEVCHRTEDYCADWFEEDFSFQENLQKGEATPDLEKDLEREVAYQSEIDQMIAQAKQEKEQQSKMVLFPSQQTKGANIRKNRKEEASAQRVRETFLPIDEMRKSKSPKKPEVNGHTADILRWIKEENKDE